MQIRRAEPGDIAEIAALIHELAAYEKMPDAAIFAEADLAEHLFGPRPAACVDIAVTDDGTVAGFALWFVTYSTFLGRPGIWLEDLFVRPEHRRGGIGRALLEHLRDSTTGRVEWSVLDWNTPAIAFY
jgi:GNAT superfamily N-acetyltransferase